MTDQFTKYSKDPRIEKSVYKNTMSPVLAPKNELLEKIKNITDEEQFLDELRLYKKKRRQYIIEKYESQPFKNRRIILQELSNTADNILSASLNYLGARLRSKYGLPSYLSAYKQIQPSHLAILGMGKLGSQKINYRSDLDLIFIYSHVGETLGQKPLSNAEYFIKLAQKLIWSLSVMTETGRCYEIDTELRPSGNMGMLVTSYDHFVDHQMNRAQNWERQALIRARPMSEDAAFEKLLHHQLIKLVYERPLPANHAEEMRAIRERVLNERAREDKKRFDLKLGNGSLMDIEFILHNIQLKHGRVFPDLRQRSLFDLLDALKNHDLLEKSDLEKLTRTHLYYRTLESQLHLVKNRAESVIDFASKTFQEICGRLKLKSDTLKNEISDMREHVNKIYKKIYAP